MDPDVEIVHDVYTILAEQNQNAEKYTRTLSGLWMADNHRE